MSDANANPPNSVRGNRWRTALALALPLALPLGAALLGAGHLALAADGEPARTPVRLEQLRCAAQTPQGNREVGRGERFSAKSPPGLRCTARLVTVRAARSVQPSIGQQVHLELYPGGSQPRSIGEPLPLSLAQLEGKEPLTVSANPDEVRRAVPMAGSYLLGLSVGSSDLERARTRRGLRLSFEAPTDEGPQPPAPPGPPRGPHRPQPPRPAPVDPA
jgi:hypothetical protein